jgi:hemerythrin-like domain-containing protein
MANEIFKLRKEHLNFKKMLNLLERQLDLLHKGEEPNYQIMADILCYMTEYSDVSHHPREETIFSLLAERDSATKIDVAEITRQHHAIGEAGFNFHKKLENIINGESEIIRLEEIETPGRIYVTILRAHMEKEEQSLFVMAEKLFNDDDWKKVKTDMQISISDPIFGKDVEERFSFLCNQLLQIDSDNKKNLSPSSS